MITNFGNGYRATGNVTIDKSFPLKHSNGLVRLILATKIPFKKLIYFINLILFEKGIGKLFKDFVPYIETKSGGSSCGIVVNTLDCKIVGMEGMLQFLNLATKKSNKGI